MITVMHRLRKLIQGFNLISTKKSSPAFNSAHSRPGTYIHICRRKGHAVLNWFFVLAGLFMMSCVTVRAMVSVAGGFVL